ncbi:Peptide hydrolase [Pleurostoma richardsiae]|uniref:Peptide hydrolase n=1 Tax=Pleurostoma richardsiae TaxID=41990 RepID=A0AA38RSY3_9PEZI|nr:Peptide hydrolase [Pleurostoma richardsiae]
MSQRRTVLVTGATGKQGRALIHALLRQSPDYHVLALTRRAAAPPARLLLAAEDEDRITLIEATLDDEHSIRRVFADAAAVGKAIWGVFAVLAYPGLGANADGEERQGKMMADLALEFQVQVFVYSSAIPSATDDNALDMSHQAKFRIERYCEDLGSKGLKWVIIRPGFFMENFDGFLGAVAFGVLHRGLPAGTTIALIASEDIGNVTAGVFGEPERYLHKVLCATSGPVTTPQIMSSYKRATGKPMPSIPGVLAKTLIRMNGGVQIVVKQTAEAHRMRTNGEYPTFEAEVALARSTSSIQTFYEWKTNHNSVAMTERGDEGLGNWNKVSFTKLFTGRS